MAIYETIKIGDKDVSFKASAALPRIYRNTYERDIFTDMETVENALKEEMEGTASLSCTLLEIFENLMFVMAKHADETIPDTTEAWLENFKSINILTILPRILILWKRNLGTLSEPVKKNTQTEE